MKKFLAILVLGLLWSNFSMAQSMVSLEKYIEENSKNADDPVTQAYVLKRCGAAYLYAATKIQDKDKQTSKILFEAYLEVTMFAGEMLMNKMDWSEEDAGDNIENDVKNMLKYYEKDGNDSFARTGEYMMNNYIGKDLEFCKGIFESIQ